MVVLLVLLPVFLYVLLQFYLQVVLVHVVLSERVWLAGVSNVYSILLVVLHVVRVDARDCLGQQEQPTPLILLDTVPGDEACAVEQDDAIEIALDYIGLNLEVVLSFDDKNSLLLALFNPVEDNLGARTSLSAESYISFDVLEDEISNDFSGRPFLNQHALVVVLKNGVALLHIFV